jgi:gas vesicle protein
MSQEILTAIGTIVGIALVMVVRDWRDGKSLLKKNGNNIHDEVKAILQSQGQLKQHYNEETTELLSRISEGIDRLNRKHDEWDKYGIVTRDCKKNGD